MNRYTLPSLLFLFLFSFSSVDAQQILTIIENHGTKKDTVSYGYNQIVDINSNLELIVSKDSIIKVISEQYPELLKRVELEAEIVKLDKALKNQSVILKGLKTQVITTQSRNDFYNVLVKLYNFIGDPANGMEDEFNSYMVEYRDLYMANLQDAPVTRMEYVFNKLSTKLLNVEKALATMENDDIRISVVGYKRDKSGGGRVHIKNFDTYSDLEYVTIPRWVTSISEDQKKKLAELSNTLENNKVDLRDVFDALKAKFNEYLPDLKCAKAIKENLEELLSNTDLSSITEEVRNAVKNLINDIDSIVTLTSILKKDVSTWDITTVFTISDAVQSIVKDLSDTDLSIKTLITKIDTLNDLRQWVTEFEEQVGDCFMDSVKEFNKMKDAVASLLNQQKNYIANKSIGDQVLSFSVSNIPSVGFLNLKGTGQRANGDEILLEVVMRKPKKDTAETNGSQVFEKSITLEETSLVMQLVGARSEIAIGMIFADPFSSDINIVDPGKRHFFTPSASLLLKFGSRTSNFYNNFVDFGIGINFATPDFNLDGNPEFGTGIIGTAFKDILSVGINYNVTHDTFYWFFGVNLPFNIPGIPINSIETSSKQ